MSEMSDTDYRPKGRPFTGRKFLYVILSFFGVIIAVNVVMAYLAVHNFRGVIVDSGYVASQSFNADEAALAEQAARGWAFETSAPGGAPLIAIRDRDGAPIEGLALEATAIRPVDQNMDRPLAMQETAPGLYAANAALPAGKWRIALAAEGEGARYSTVLDLYIEKR
jgi:nitrogen fixation protein FixH